MLRAPGSAADRSGSGLGVEALDRQEVASFPRAARIAVRLDGRRGHLTRISGRQDDHLLVGHADDQPRFDPESLREAFEDDLRLLEGIANVVEANAHVDHRLEVGASLSKLALVQRGEMATSRARHAERGHVEDRHPIELDPRPGVTSTAGTSWAACA